MKYEVLTHKIQFFLHEIHDMDNIFSSSPTMDKILNENLKKIAQIILQLILSGEYHVNGSDTCPIKDKSPSKCRELPLYNKHLFAMNVCIQRINTL